jgi:hypothetical protein
MTDQDTVQLQEDYADEPFPPMARVSLLLPIAAVLGFALEAWALLSEWAPARANYTAVFRDVPLFGFAAAPFAVLAGFGLLLRRDRGMQAGLLPVLAIVTVAGVWAAANKSVHTRGGFEELGMFLVYLLQWAIVGVGVFVALVGLALSRR